MSGAQKSQPQAITSFAGQYFVDGFMAPPAGRGDTRDDADESPLAGHHIGPERIDLLRFERVSPRRHLVLAAGDRGDEALALVARKFAQVEGALGALHARAVAGRAVDCEQFGALRDQLGRETFLSARG